jgi:hypothetical protein
MIGAQDLLDALEEKRGEFKEEKWRIICEIVDIRVQIEEHHSGAFGKESSLPDSSTLLTRIGLNSDSCFYAPDYSEVSRSTRSGAQADVDDLEVDTDQAEPSGGNTGDESDDAEPLASASVPSSTIEAHDEALATRNHQDTATSTTTNEDSLHSNQAMEDFDNGMIKSDARAGEQDSIGMAVDPRPFVRDAKPGTLHQYQQGSLDTEATLYRSQPAMGTGLDLMTNPWMAAGTTGGYEETAYALDDTQMLGHDEYAVPHLGLAHNHRQNMAMNTLHPMHVAGGHPYQLYGHSESRAMPIRGMTHPHQSELNHPPMHGLGIGPSSFYSS